MGRTRICQSHLCPWSGSPNSRVPGEPSCVEAPGAQGGEARRGWGGWAQIRTWEGGGEWGGEQGEQVMTDVTEVGSGAFEQRVGEAPRGQSSASGTWGRFQRSGRYGPLLQVRRSSYSWPRGRAGSLEAGECPRLPPRPWLPWPGSVGPLRRVLTPQHSSSRREAGRGHRERTGSWKASVTGFGRFRKGAWQSCPGWKGGHRFSHDSCGTRAMAFAWRVRAEPSAPSGASSRAGRGPSRRPESHKLSSSGRLLVLEASLPNMDAASKAALVPCYSATRPLPLIRSFLGYPLESARPATECGFRPR